MGKHNSNGQAAIRHPEKKIRVVPCNFDENTANVLAQPSNRSPKGEVSGAKARCNKTGWIPGLPEPTSDDDGFQTWVFGIRAIDGEPLRLELSFPTEFNGQYYTHFSRRIVILSGDEGDGSPRREGLRDGPTEIVDIAITRK